jgi:hypothetical protein
MRPRHGSGQKIPARELRRGDVVGGSGWEVLSVEERDGGAKIHANFTAVGGRLREKTYDAERLIEVVRTS